MAVEVGNFIKDQLEKLPADHPDRRFLEGQFWATVGWLLIRKDQEVGGESEALSVIKAKGELQMLVDGTKLKIKCTKRMIERNREEMRTSFSTHGKESVMSLLPVEFGLFKNIINSLKFGYIFTKKELINAQLDYLWHLRNVGKTKFPIINAMRNLAIAESRAQAPKNLQI